MITIAICDDDIAFAAMFAVQLQRLCQAAHTSEAVEPEETQVVHFNAAEDLVRYAEEHPLHIVFLDIEMEQMDGFQAAKSLKAICPEGILIFVSNHEDYIYSFSFYENSPFYFLRKSCLDTMLPSVLQTALDKCYTFAQTIELQTVSGPVTVRAKDICYCENEKNYYRIYCTAGAVHRCRGALRDLEERLRPYNILRCDTGSLIHIAHIRRLDTEAHTVQLDSGKIVPVSRRHWVQIRKSFADFCYKEARM